MEGQSEIPGHYQFPLEGKSSSSMVGGMFSLLRSLTMCKISSYRFESSDEPLRGLHDHREAGVSRHQAGMCTVAAASDYFWLGVFINNYLEAHSTISQGCAGGSRSFRKVLIEHNSVSRSNCHIPSNSILLTFSFFQSTNILYKPGNQGLPSATFPVLCRLHPQPE